MDAMTIAAAGMQSDLQRLNSISQNLANVMTPGYKREIPVSQTFGNFVDALSPPAADQATPPQAPVVLDTSAGTLRYTANPLDVAIEGPGFFEVMTESGPAYTRQGALRTDSRGRLVTGQGHPLMGTGGEMTVSGTTMTIAQDGEVRQGERLVGKMKLVQFANPNGLVALGSGLFGQGTAKTSDLEVRSAIRVGYQENSNVNSAHEMVRLSETVRHFESMQKIMQGYDEVLEKAIRKLGEF